MKSKCIKFMELKSINVVKYNTQKRFQSLLTVFPQEVFVKVLN